MRNILITGGAGFIGSHVVRRFVNKYANYRIVNLDLLTYAGNLENLVDIEQRPNYNFIKGDICDPLLLRKIFDKYDINGVIHLAAESHVDRSIDDPLSFIHTNIYGTATLLNISKEYWGKNFEGKIFYQISTDEVFGSLPMDESLFTEKTPYDPRSPYSASKAASDHLVRAYHHTYGMPNIISNCSNNYGPNHFPEKLIPLFINNIIHKRSLPVYGKGENVRDWLYVTDHARAIDAIFHNGKIGESYNVGGNNEWKNIDLIHLLCKLMDEKLGREKGESAKLITYVQDRAGHDLRYAIDATKIKDELGWTPEYTFERGIEETIDWYLSNTEWLSHVTSGSYMEYYAHQYKTSIE